MQVSIPTEREIASVALMYFRMTNGGGGDIVKSRRPHTLYSTLLYITDRMQMANYRVFVISDMEVRGFSILHWSRSEDYLVGFVDDIWIDPLYRRSSYGKVLGGYVVDYLISEIGVKYIDCITEVGNEPALAFIKSFGLTPICHYLSMEVKDEAVE